MCGITGYLGSSPVTRDASVIKNMLGMIRHRGPDEMGYFVDDNAALGTARLSVVDLKLGQQPFSDASGRYWLTYNGEVYNYLELKHELMALGQAP